MLLWRLALVGAGWSGMVPDLRSHTLPISYLRIVPEADYVHLELTFNPFELNFYSELDWNKNGRLDAAEWEAQEPEVTRLVLGGLKLRLEGAAVEAVVAGTTLHRDSHHATLRAHYPVAAPVHALSVQSSLATLTSGSHFTEVTFGREGSTQAARLDLFRGVANFAVDSSRRATPERAGSRLEAITSNRPGVPSDGVPFRPAPYPSGQSGPGLGWISLLLFVVLPVLAWGGAMTRYARKRNPCPLNPGSELPEAATSETSRTP